MISRSIHQLCLFSQRFLKTAGTIQVPPALLSQALAITTSSAAALISDRLSEIISGSQERQDTTAEFAELAQRWQSAAWHLQDAQEKTQDPAAYLRLADRILRRLSPLPGLHPGIHKKTRLKGYIDNGSISLELRLDLERLEGTFYAFIPRVESINDSPQQDMVRHALDTPSFSSEEELASWLKSILPTLDAAVSSFQGFLRWGMEPAHSLKQMIRLRAFLQPKARQAEKSDIGTYGKLITVDTKDFPYGKSLPASVPALRFGLQTVDTEGARSASESDPDSWNGLWKPADLIKNRGYIGTAYVHVNLAKILDYLQDRNFDPSLIDRELAQVVDTTRHELQHFVQTFLEYTVSHQEKTDIRSGISSQEADYRYDSYGTPVTYDAKGKSHIDRSRLEQSHDLRDVEFSPELQDQIEKFRFQSRRIPLALRDDYARLWLGLSSRQDFEAKIEAQAGSSTMTAEQLAAAASAIMATMSKASGNSFIMELKQSQPKKYDRAVREFWKAIH